MKAAKNQAQNMLHISAIANKIHCEIFHPEAISLPRSVCLSSSLFFTHTHAHFNSFRLFKTLLHLPELPFFSIRARRAFCGLSVVSSQMKYHIQIMCHSTSFCQLNFPLKQIPFHRGCRVNALVNDVFRYFIRRHQASRCHCSFHFFSHLKSKFSIQLQIKNKSQII